MLYGVGITDVDYIVNKCPFYLKWQQVIRRCDSTEYTLKRPNLSADISDDWRYFSKFRKWMEEQEWQNKEIDKDLLIRGNRLYSAETCLLVDTVVNTFINEFRTKQSDLPIGCSRQKNGKIIVQVKDWESGQRVYVGTFDSVDLAKRAYYETKHRFAVRLAETQTNEKVVNALLTRYL